MEHRTKNPPVMELVDLKIRKFRKLVNAFRRIKLIDAERCQRWSERYTLFLHAVKNGHAAVALLLTSGARVNNQSETPSDTLLHFATIYGDIGIVEMIINKGADINAKNEYGRTPLLYAILKKNMGIIELLLQNGADVNVKESDGTSILYTAAESGCLQITELLLKYGAFVFSVFTKILKKGYVPLHFAVEIGSEEVTTFLLSRGTNVDVKAQDCLTPLHIAAMKGYIYIAEILLNHGASIHSMTLRNGYTPLHFASEQGKAEVVEFFLNKGADINFSANGNVTPLYIAVEAKQESVVKLLLQHGAKVEIMDLKYGKTALNIAVELGYLEIVKLILKYGLDINDQSYKSSLKIAVKDREEDKKIVEALLKNGLIVNPEDANDPMLLHAAVQVGYLKIIEDLLKYGADVNMLDNSTGFTPLHRAAKYKQEDVAKLLISHEAHVNPRDKSGRTPIFYAVKNADFKMFMLLFTNGAVVIDPKLLNVSVAKGCIEIVQVLLQHAADVKAIDEYGRTALHFTALNETEDPHALLTNKNPDNIKGEIAKLLLSQGANVDAQARNGVTTLHLAVQKGYAEVVSALLKYNANVNSVVQNNIAPLHLSARSGNEEITTMLLNKGANVNAKQKNGITALHIATYKDHRVIVKLLIECGAKVDSKMNNSDITPIHLGALKGNWQIIETLLKFGANIDSRDYFGRTALHIACQEKHREVLQKLLENGSNIHITSRNDCTPLDYGRSEKRSIIRRNNGHHKNNFSDRSLDFYYDQDHYDEYFSIDRSFSKSPLIMHIEEIFIRHIVKLKTANLYVSTDLASLLECRFAVLNGYTVREIISDYQEICEREITSIRSENIGNLNLSFYDILSKGKNSLAMYMRNENIVQALKSDDFQTRFPIYAGIIERKCIKGVERNKLLEQCNDIFDFLFYNVPELPYDCTEQIFSYLSNEELRILIEKTVTQ